MHTRHVLSRLSKAFGLASVLLFTVLLGLALEGATASPASAIEGEHDSAVSLAEPSSSDAGVPSAVSLRPADEAPPIPLPLHCDGVTPPGGTVPSCCIFGYVWDGDTIVSGATVTITSLSGSLVLTTTTGPDSGAAYYGAALDTPPLEVLAGETITLTVSYSDTTASRTWAVESEGQQVDVGIAGQDQEAFSFTENTIADTLDAATPQIPDWRAGVQGDAHHVASTGVITTINVGEHPRAVAFAPDGTLAYVSHQAEATVKVIRVSDHTVVDTITVGETITTNYNLLGLDVTPDGQHLYVVWKGRDVVVPIRTADGLVLPEIPVCGSPSSIAITPDGSLAYVTCFFNEVNVIQTSSNTVVDHIDLPPGSQATGIVISPDGSEVYVNDNIGNQVYIIRASDNTIVDSVPVGDGPHHDVDVTPDGATIYTTGSEGGSVEAVRLSDRHVDHISLGGGPSGVAVTPDGQYVYVSAYNTNRVSVIRTPDNAVLEHIAVGDRPDGIIDVSPDGRYVYVSNRNDNTISVIAARPTIPPGRIAFTSHRDGNHEIYIMDSRGISQTRLTFNAPGDDNKPLWSPDGTEIAFTRGYGSDSTEVRLMDAALGDPDNLSSTLLASHWRVELGAWSPDGSQLLFSKGGGETEDMFRLLIDRPDLEPEQLTFTCGENSAVDWSPDGSTIAFISSAGVCWPSCSDIYLYFMDSDGGNIRPVLDGDGERILARGGRWSPDGSKLLLARNCGPDGPSLHTMNPDGTDLTLLWQSPSGVFLGDWSPDGSMITFCTDGEVYVIKSDGSGEPINISNLPGSNCLPDWHGYPQMRANFTAAPVTGTVPLGVQFTDQSIGRIVAWDWLFGDGSKSGARHPFHHYEDPGTYTVSLTVTNPTGSDTETKDDYITATCPPPVAGFSASPLSGRVPLTVTFTDHSSGEIDSWLWDLGDGNTSNEKNPIHIYNTPGTYAVTLTVSGSCGSDSLTRPEYIEATSTAQLKTWTFMLYLAGDNNLSPRFQRAVERMEQVPPRSNLDVLVLIDRWNEGDTRLYEIEYHPGSGVGSAEIPIPWTTGSEVNTGDQDTLENFVTWARGYSSADHYFLSIANHGRGTSGIAWDEDTSSGGDHLHSYDELGAALSSVTNGGTSKIDVLMFDACLMALLEVDYEIKDTVNYIVASQNLGWSVFAYDRYMEAIGDATDPATLADAVASEYFEALPDAPRTISAVDVSGLAALGSAVDVLAQALIDEVSGGDIARLKGIRDVVQVFDSYFPYDGPDPFDEYVDLYHFAELVKANFGENPSLTAAAQGVMDAVDTAVLYEGSQSAQDIWSGNYWELDDAHGVAVYFPPRNSGRDYERYVDPEDLQDWAFTGQTQWDEFLVEYFSLTGLPPTPWEDPGYPQMGDADYRVFLPFVAKGR